MGSFLEGMTLRPPLQASGLNWTVVESGLHYIFKCTSSESNLQSELRRCPSLVGRSLPGSS